MHDEPISKQLLLPRVGLIWSFVAITLAAILIALVRELDRGAALISAIVLTLAWIAVLFAMFSVLFLVTYSLGLLEDLLAPQQDDVLSPFADDRLPEQIVPPLKTDAQ
jgi:tellurite resistance protein TehA-like permease